MSVGGDGGDEDNDDHNGGDNDYNYNDGVDDGSDAIFFIAAAVDGAVYFPPNGQSKREVGPHLNIKTGFPRYGKAPNTHLLYTPVALGHSMNLSVGYCKEKWRKVTGVQLCPINIVWEINYSDKGARSYLYLVLAINSYVAKFYRKTPTYVVQNEL